MVLLDTYQDLVSSHILVAGPRRRMEELETSPVLVKESSRVMIWHGYMVLLATYHLLAIVIKHARELQVIMVVLVMV